MIAPHLSPSQHGFRRYRSRVMQILQYVHNLATSLDAGEQIDNLYLDMETAFDQASHEKLLYKLEYSGFHNPLLHWISDYLTNKWHRVSIDGISSDWKYVSSGVPQGSIIGLIFVYYLHKWYWIRPISWNFITPLCQWHKMQQSYSTRPRHTATRRIHLMSMEWDLGYEVWH